MALEMWKSEVIKPLQESLIKALLLEVTKYENICFFLFFWKRPNFSFLCIHLKLF